MTEDSKVGFTTMEAGTRADYDLVFTHDEANAAGVADRALGWLRSMDDESPYRVTRLGHSLQSATRAEADGADAETIVCALLHDVGDVLSPLNHSQVAAALLRPYVSDKNYWVVQHHGLFQGYYWFHHFDRDRDERDRYQAHEFYDECVRFCAEWDQNCFDPAYPTSPLEHFEPLVRELFANPRESIV